MTVRTKQQRVEFRVEAEVLKRWRLTAAVTGISLSEWVRQLCNRAVRAKERRK